MVLINLIFFFSGIISYIFYKIFFKNKKTKYVKISPTIEKKKFTNVSESILREQLDRNYLFFEEDGMNLIKKSSVAIFNCENIGSNIALTLARSGIKKLILIDNNILSIDNYKYHPFAICENINKRILNILEDYIRQINPNIELILIKENINYDNLSFYFKKNNIPDYIVDCISEANIIQKCKLIKFAKGNDINFISTFTPLQYQNDPTQIRHSNYSLINNSHITSLITQNFKKLYNTTVVEFNLVYSEQKKSQNFGKISENLFCYGVISDTASSIVLCDLSKFKIKIDNAKKEKEKEKIKIGGKFLSEAIEEYKNDEITKKKTKEKYLSKLTYNDFKLICAGFKNGSSIKQKPTTKMKFTRWRLFKEPSRNNIVIMGKNEINSHSKIHNEEELVKFYTKPVVDRIDGILNSLIDK